MQESLRLTQEQKLVQRLSPMQVRYVRMLEMNSLEMDEAVRRELDDNQALAIDDSVTERQQTEDGRDFTESSEELQRKDYADDDDIPYYRLNTNNYSSDSSGYDYIQPDNSETLYDNLCRQIDERDISEDVAQTAKYIIGNLDSNGWLQRDLMLIIDDLAFQHGIEVPENIARQALKEVRSLEPVGIGAKDLRDCLMLQLNALPATPNNYIARLIIADHFDEFSLKHFDRIRSLLKLDADTFQKALDTVLNLNPKPGASIGNSQTDNRSQQIIADFIIDIDDDDIRITLNNNIPDLHIEESFENAVARMEANARKRQEQGREFILSRYNDARDFIDALKLRQETLFAVISAIVKIQKEYFLTEDEHNLRPMALKDVAAITGYDISVISRSTANKYISTPWGILPLRFFFSEGVGEGDDEASAREIQAAIKQIIENEDKRRPLSDDLICRKLNEKGYDIRRRTVAKYRDRLGIPVARLRRTSQ